MPPIADPWNLDPTSPVSNSNFNSVNIAENCPPSTINNGLRQLGTFLAQATSYKSADLSTSVSTNIAASGTGLYMDLTGANAVNHFGSPAGAEQPNAAVFRFLQYDSSASVSHGANIKLIGSASRKMQPGDVQGVIHEGSGVWREFCFGSASGNLPMDSLSVTTITNRSLSTSAISTVTLNAASASVTAIALTGVTTLNANSISASVGEFTLLSAGGKPTTIHHGRATSVTYETCGTDLPVDDSIPQITEGVEVLSLTVTPTNAASVLHIRTDLALGAAAAGLVGAGLWIDSTAGALNADGTRVEGSTDVQRLVMDHYVSASNTTQRVYHVRIGPDAGGPANAFLNGSGGGRYFGGVMRSTLSVDEILP